MTSFSTRARKAIQDRGFLIQGLDPVFERIPIHILERFGFNPTMVIAMFLLPIIDAVAPYVSGFKPNVSFFVAFDDYKNGRLWGQEALMTVCQYIRQNYPDHLLILDAKDGDIGKSNDGYAYRAFEGLDADAVTWDPYLGTTIGSQLDRYPGKGFIALGRTSNNEGTALQNLELTDGRKVFEATVDEWERLRRYGYNIGFVAGATHPEELKAIRRRVGAAYLLIPGVGTQGGDARTVTKAGFGGKYGNMGINVSSASLYANGDEQFAEAARDVMHKLWRETKFNNAGVNAF